MPLKKASRETMGHWQWFEQQFTVRQKKGFKHYSFTKIGPQMTVWSRKWVPERSDRRSLHTPTTPMKATKKADKAQRQRKISVVKAMKSMKSE